MMYDVALLWNAACALWDYEIWTTEQLVEFASRIFDDSVLGDVMVTIHHLDMQDMPCLEF